MKYEFKLNGKPTTLEELKNLSFSWFMVGDELLEKGKVEVEGLDSEVGFDLVEIVEVKEQ